MTTIVNMHQAKSQLSKLVDAVESGEEQEIIIARNGKPAVKLVPLPQVDVSKRLGIAEGKYADFTLEEFNAMDDEIARMFYGEDIEPGKKASRR